MQFLRSALAFPHTPQFGVESHTHTRCILYRRLKHLIFQTVFLFSLYTSYNRFARYKLHVLFWGSEVTFAYGPGRVEKLLKLILESEYIT